MSIAPQALNGSFTLTDNGDGTVTMVVTVKNNAGTQTLATNTYNFNKSNITATGALRKILRDCAAVEDNDVAWTDLPSSATFNIPLMTIIDLVG